MVGMSDGTHSTSLRPKSSSTVRSAGKVPSTSLSRSSARTTSDCDTMSTSFIFASGTGSSS